MQLTLVLPDAPLVRTIFAEKIRNSCRQVGRGGMSTSLQSQTYIDGQLCRNQDSQFTTLSATRSTWSASRKKQRR